MDGRVQGRRRSALWGALILAGGLLLGGCEGLLDVELPGAMEESDLDDPALAELLTQSVIADFECAFNNYVGTTAMLGDELQHASGSATIRRWDLRQLTPDMTEGSCTGYGFYGPVNNARFLGAELVRRLEGYTDEEVADRTQKMATGAAYEGYAIALLSESMCGLALDEGPLLRSAQGLEIAEETFTRALSLAEAAGDHELLHLARVGRARVRLKLGKGSEAVDDAEQVPDGFESLVTRSADEDRRQNFIWQSNHNGRTTVVEPPFRGLTWEGVRDGRVDVVDTGQPASTAIQRSWVTMKHASADSPIRLASWTEAQLIIAEVEGGQTAVDIINDLHHRAEIPGFTSDDPAEIAAQVLEERRRELFLEGQRHGDMLRFDLPFPSGTHVVDDQPYGPATCIPLPDSETESNPNVGG